MEIHLISDVFDKYFRIIFAVTPELRQEVYRLRYQVYCKELQYESADKYPEGLERDEFDHRSCHCLLQHRSSGEYAGCIRLVLPDPDNPKAILPFEIPCAGKIYPDMIEPIFDHRDLLGEYSRLAVPERFRRRKGEKNKLLGNIENDTPGPDEKRQFLHIPFGLYLAGAAAAVASGLDGVIAMMEPRLARHLHRFGMVYEQVGDIVDHRGPRAPFYCSRETLFKYLHPEIRNMLDKLLVDFTALPLTEREKT